MPPPLSHRSGREAKDSAPARHLRAIVRQYCALLSRRGDDELAFYREQKSLRDAILHAGMATIASGHRHPHQYRIPRRALERATGALLSARISPPISFDELYSTVHDAIVPIPGIGDLMVYDTCRRIGAYLQVEPERVYLHAGTRLGARAIGLRVNRGTVDVAELPPEFRTLTPGQIEDCLCIFKDELANVLGDE